MKVCIIGCTGFLGSQLLKKCKKKKIKTIKINSRKFLNKKKRILLIKKIFSANVIVNCASSLNPQKYEDHFINEEFPEFLIKMNKKYNKKILHISTNNCAIPDRQDIYTVSKRIGEKKILGKSIIIRLPFLYEKNKGKINNKGNLRILFKYLSYNLPIYPMIYPGNIYRPLNIDLVTEFLIKIMKFRERYQVYNLESKNKISLFDLFLQIAKSKNKKVLRIYTKNIFNFFFPKFILRFFKRNIIFQNLISVNNTLPKSVKRIYL